MNTTQDNATEIVRRRYDRRASIYDVMEASAERWRFGKWREILWSKVEGTNILEVGVGTGKNFPYYPAEAQITAIDFSKKMLARARDKAQKIKLKVHLVQMDVQKLEFADNTFDTVVEPLFFAQFPTPS